MDPVRRAPTEAGSPLENEDQRPLRQEAPSQGNAHCNGHSVYSIFLLALTTWEARSL